MPVFKIYFIQFLVPKADSYKLACRGFYSNRLSRLYCLYNSTNSPFLYLAPLKMELLQLEPYMAMYHDIISDNEIEELKSMASPQLKRATVYNENNKPMVISTRTAKSFGFDDNASDTTRRLMQRISDMTGMDTEGSEELQIMNYGLGGHYDTHYDFFNVSEVNGELKEFL